MSKSIKSTPAVPTVSKAATNRSEIITFSGYAAAQRVTELLKELEDTFLRVHKRKMAVDLFISSTGPRGKEKLGITVHWEPGQESEVQFLTDLIASSN